MASPFHQQHPGGLNNDNSIQPRNHYESRPRNDRGHVRAGRSRRPCTPRSSNRGRIQGSNPTRFDTATSQALRTAAVTGPAILDGGGQLDGGTPSHLGRGAGRYFEKRKSQWVKGSAPVADNDHDNFQLRSEHSNWRGRGWSDGTDHMGEFYHPEREPLMFFAPISTPVYVYPCPPSGPTPTQGYIQPFPRRGGVAARGRSWTFKSSMRSGGTAVQGPNNHHRDNRGQWYQHHRNENFQATGGMSNSGPSSMQGLKIGQVKNEESEVDNDLARTNSVESGGGRSHESMQHLKYDHALQSRKPYSKKSSGADDDGTQKERLTEEIIRGTYECMVCCDRVRPSHEVWSCLNCYHIFHLRCIKKWALSPTASVDESGWRCPGCQNVTEKVPNQYRCFCGKVHHPEWNRYDTPHSCGEQCGKKRSQQNCIHPCNVLCHPGPCPPCGIYVDRSCSCGNQTMKVRCGQAKPFSCGQPCSKLLNCGQHACPANCHKDQCNPCEEIVQRNCFCGKQSEEVLCTKETVNGSRYSCGSKCNKPLDCENHQCSLTCHPGKCELCELTPFLLTHCPCGQTLLSDLLPTNQPRQACTDPIPVCSKTCSKKLHCGPEDDPHQCQSQCHLGSCPSCPLTSFRKCCCGALKKEILCSELTPGLMVICKKRCNKKKNCGRHKCSQYCCTDITHRCNLVCGRKLSCGLHQCEETCHLGNCPSCWNTSFEELTCRCGAVIMYPPIPCNTKPPECNKPCSRHHGCDHAVTHSCHSEAQCPPCTFLTSKLCYGEHELRTCIPCFQTSVCCGMPCNKTLPCGQHRCIQICHEGPCASETFKCMQPCPKVKPQCGHPCNMPCHEGDCPPQSCKANVAVTCRCGNRSGTMTCTENMLTFHRLMSSAMALKHHAMEQGQTVDFTDIMKDGDLKRNCTLECNDECSQIERNRRFALALQIQNPELTSKLKPPVYSDFLKEQMRQNGAFVTLIFNKLTDLVQSAKQSKQKSRSHAFPTMKSDHRRVIHELAEFFGCETQSYDEEPKKNVAATAFKDKSWLPSMSIMAVVQKESGTTRQAGKAPPPIPHHTHRNSVPPSWTGSTTSITNLVSTSVGSAKKPEASAPIDYFDYNE